MAKNILVISCDYRETRAALIENGIIAELHIERKGRQSGTVGNVYLGKVTRVLPGLQAAFIDIGQERAAFLHVEDLIRPDDFDEYLAGGRKLARGEEGGVATEDAPEETDEAPAEPAAAEGEPAAAEGEPAAVIEAHGGVPESPMDSNTELVAVATRAGADDGGAFAEPAPSEGVPAVVLPVRGDDLEATVSYPNWPEPPARMREPRRPQNGTSTARRALDAEPPPSSGPLSSEPPSTESAPPSSLGELDEDEDDEDDDGVEDVEDEDGVEDEDDGVEDEDDDVEAAAPSTHSLNSQPTLDELPDDGSDSERPTAVAGGREVAAADLDDEDDDDLLDDGDLPGFTISDPGEPVPRAPAPRAAGASADRE
ncbi:MAG: hypothetical protein KIS78_27365, partial [Labilithrix sp.]|nr:hypothetical protein [Labilithrix sp.]